MTRRLNADLARILVGAAAAVFLTTSHMGYRASAQTFEAVRAESAAHSDEFTTDIEAALDELDLVPGLAVAVIRGSDAVYARGFGYRDLERELPVETGTIFYTASLAKAFTGMTAAVLAARGDLDLEAPLSTFYPQLRLPEPLSPEEVTVRDLLRHTKGFANGGVNFVTSFVGPYAEEDLLRVLTEYSTLTNGAFTYSNTSYALVGYIIEQTTGRPWKEVMEDVLFEPLHMHQSTAYLSQVPDGRLAVPYMAGSDGFERIRMLKTDETITGAGGIFSTVDDLARFVIANLNEGRLDRQVLPIAAVEMAHAAQVDLRMQFYEFDRHAYGLGFYRANYDGDLMIHHFGGFPGYRSHLSFMPEHGLGVIVLQNEGRDGNGVADLVATYVYDRLLGKPDFEARLRRRIRDLREDVEEARRSRADAEIRLARLKSAPGEPSLPLASYEGVYENERLGRLRIVQRGSGLNVVFGALSGPAIPSGGHDFVVDWIPGSPATFTFDVAESNLVTGFHWGPRPFLQLPELDAKR